MTKSEIITSISQKVKVKFEDEASGHDWWHIYRVWKLSIKIGEEEGADLFIIELAALLHDIADWKFHKGDDKAGGKVALEILKIYNIENNIILKVAEIIDAISYKGAGVKESMQSVEGKIVQDADRIDAIGAIGIARTFAYGGSKGRLMHNPEIKPILHSSFEEYKNSSDPTINHFYEKLLLLKNRMNTRTGLRIAQKRHDFMEQYLNQFYLEWECEV